MDLGDRFCKFVSCTPEVSNATARIGAWLIGVAEQRGGSLWSLPTDKYAMAFKWMMTASPGRAVAWRPSRQQCSG